MNNPTKQFIGVAIHHLITKQVSIHLIPEKRIEECNGYFDQGVPVLKVATGKPEQEWLPIFVHEYCHFIQWQNKEFKDEDTGINWELWDDWSFGKQEVKREIIVPMLYSIRDVELDCDRKALELIKQYDLPIDQMDYIRRANAYALFYNVVAKKAEPNGTGWWYKTAPYEVQEILDIVPDDKINPCKNTPREFVELINKHCF